VTPVDGIVRGLRSINGDVEFFSKASYSSDMVCVVVSDKHRHDVLQGYAVFPKRFLDGAQANSGVDQNAGGCLSQEVAVATAPAGQT